MKRQDYRNWTTLLMIAVVALAVIFAWAVVANAQEDTTVVVDSSTSFEGWVDSAFKVLLAGLGLVLTWAIKTAVDAVAKTLPTVAGDFVRGWMDDKRQRDLHSAIMSKIASIIKEGRWTGNAMDFIDEIKRNVLDSTPAAAKHFDITAVANGKVDKVLAGIAERKAIEVQGQLAKAMSDAALATEVVKQVNDPRVDALLTNVNKIFAADTKVDTSVKPSKR